MAEILQSRIPDSLLSGDEFPDGKILRGEDVHRIIEILKAGINANKNEIDGIAPDLESVSRFFVGFEPPEDTNKYEFWLGIVENNEFETLQTLGFFSTEDYDDSNQFELEDNLPTEEDEKEPFVLEGTGDPEDFVDENVLDEEPVSSFDFIPDEPEEQEQEPFTLLSYYDKDGNFIGS